MGDLDFCSRGGKSPFLPSSLFLMCAEPPQSGGAGLRVTTLNRFPLNVHPSWISVEEELKCSAPSFLLVASRRSSALARILSNLGEMSLTRRLAETDDPDDQPRHPHDFVRTLVVVSELVRPVFTHLSINRSSIA